MDWVTIEQSLAAPYCPITILSQRVENKNLNPILSYSRSVGSRMSHLNQLYSSLWNNPKIRIGKRMMYWREWQSEGVNIISGLYEKGTFMSYLDQKRTYNPVSKREFLEIFTNKTLC